MLRTITVGELIDLLSNEDRDKLVVFACDYGDRGRTQQAIGLRGDIEEHVVTESAYSNSGYALATSDDDDIEGLERDDDDLQEVLVIR